MVCGDIRELLATLDAAGELQRIGVEVDPDQEIAEIVDRVSKMPGGGKGLVFEKVRGSNYSLALNLFGSPYRIGLALGLPELNSLTHKVSALPGKSTILNNFAPIFSTVAACQEVIEIHPDLTSYPCIRNWSGDGIPESNGFFFTLPLVFTRDRKTGSRNCGMYRVGRFGQDCVGINWGKQSGAAAHFQGYCDAGCPMPVAVALGGNPALIYAATVPLPAGVDEVEFAGFLADEPLTVVTTAVGNLEVPATAEVVIEGYVAPGNVVREGLFGNHTGAYVATGDVPLMTVTRITRRRDPVIPATIVGKPPMEDCWFAKATERLMVPFLQAEFPELADVNVIIEGAFHGAAVIAMKLGGRSPVILAEALRETPWLRDSRLLVMVDLDVNAHDLSEVFWRALNRADWERDVVVGLSRNGTAKVFTLDATRKQQTTYGPHVGGEPAREPAVVDLVNSRWKEYGF